MTVPIYKIPNVSNVLYNEFAVQRAIEHQNREMMAQIYSHGIKPYWYIRPFMHRKQFCRYRLSRKPLRDKTFYRHGMKNYKKRWETRKLINMNRMLFSIEEGVPYTVLKDENGEDMYSTRRCLCMENILSRSQRLRAYLSLFELLCSQSYSEFLKNAHTKPDKPAPKPFILKNP